MNRPKLRPLDRIIDITRPELGEVVFSCWAYAFSKNNRAISAAVCKVPGDASKLIRIPINHIQRPGQKPRSIKVRQYAPPVMPKTEAEKRLLMARLNLTEAELAEALAD